MFVPDEAAMVSAGATLGHVVRAGDVIALSGPLGAGKTCFARGLIAALGFDGEVPSPSFPIIIPYGPPETRVPVTHVDLYRIETEAACDELGLDDARSDSALIIEWPERMGSRLWADSLIIMIAADGEGRSLTATVPPSWEARWPHP